MNKRTLTRKILGTVLISVLLSTLGRGLSSEGLQAREKAKSAPVEDKGLADSGLEFRCDKMQVFNTPNRLKCENNVVIRRDNLLFCCQTLDGYADNSWQWERLVCVGDVRAWKVGDLIWSKKADYLLAISKLILSGEPYLKRGTNLLTGSKIIVNLHSDAAEVEDPRGQMSRETVEPPTKDPSAKASPTFSFLNAKDPLPAKCPLPRAPSF